MSGRLILLPKKSYCPWKPENVERVLRDERLERERVEREDSALRQHKSNQRLATLKGTSSVDTASVARKHVNLFELEESTIVKTALMGDKEKKKQAVMPVRFDSVVKKQDHLFYVRPSKARNDDRYKARMDPMKAFVRPEHEKNDRDAEDSDDEDRKSSRQRSHRRKHSSRKEFSDSEDMPRRRRHDRKRKRRKSNKKDESTDCIEELRKRRRERERTESQRETSLLADSGNDRHRRYQDQFHPGLSRR